MRLNDKNVASFAVCSSPVDKEGYLQKKGDMNRDFQRRWFILKGNLLFYFQKKQDREPQGVIVLEACSVQVSTFGRYCFEISFDGTGTRVYVLGADNDEDMQFWMKAISHASYEYLKSIVDELQRRVNVLSSSSTPQKEAAHMEVMNVGHKMASSATSVSRSKTTTRVTDVTLQELENPIAPQVGNSQRTKIKKGILVDISDEEAPPIPAKKKSLTMHTQNRVATSDKNTYTEKLLGHANFDDEQVDLPGSSHTPLTSVKSLPPPLPSPYSSPLVLNVPIENTTKPLSPPATLDRTPILQPSPLRGQDAAGDKLVLNPETAQNGATEGVGGQSSHPTEPSSHPPQVPRKLAAPLDPGKSFIEMHEDFTRAMKDLSAERTGATNHTPS